jgi:hypothetical protein
LTPSGLLPIVLNSVIFPLVIYWNKQAGGLKMTSPFPFESMLVFGWLASMLLIGVFLRAWTPFFQRFLFPSCLIGGIAGLILINTRIIDIAIGIFVNFKFLPTQTGPAVYMQLPAWRAAWR